MTDFSKREFLVLLVTSSILHLKMSYEWNIAAEVINREYRSFERCKIGPLETGSFIKGCLGSRYMIKQIDVSRIVKETRICSSNFNRKGDFICIGCRDTQIAIYDWAHNKLIDIFDSEHTEGVYGVQFMDTNENTLDIISNTYDGQIRHARILPSNELISRFLYKKSRTCPHLTSVPRSPYEFIVVDTHGNIFQMDLRCHRIVNSPDACVQNADGSYLSLFNVAHHPFSTEISIGGNDKFLRIFDKRNLKVCVRKMCPEIENLSKILKCSYNYNGSEILAKYAAEEHLYLFENRNCANDSFSTNYSISEKAGYRRSGNACFFGPKSEFVACVEPDCISFFHKKTERIVKRCPLAQGMHVVDDPYRILADLHVHPSLPLIGCASYYAGVFILAPTKKSINQENFLTEF